MAQYNLSGVTFDDGAAAQGYFDFDPTSDSFGSFDITTSNGTSDGQQGFTYDSSNSDIEKVPVPGFVVIVNEIIGNQCSHDLYITLPGDIGLQDIDPGSFSNGIIYNSGEFTDSNAHGRGIVSGELVPAPAPECNTLYSFVIFILVGGVVGAVGCLRRRARISTRLT